MFGMEWSWWVMLSWKEKRNYYMYNKELNWSISLVMVNDMEPDMWTNFLK